MASRDRLPLDGMTVGDMVVGACLCGASLYFSGKVAGYLLATLLGY